MDVIFTMKWSHSASCIIKRNLNSGFLSFKFKNMKNEGTNGEGNLIRSEKSLKLSNVVATQLLLHF